MIRFVGVKKQHRAKPQNRGTELAHIESEEQIASCFMNVVVNIPKLVPKGNFRAPWGLLDVQSAWEIKLRLMDAREKNPDLAGL